MKPGESFLFAGRKLTLKRVRDMTALVSSGGKGQTIPRWAGGKMPLSSALATTLVELMAAREHGDADSFELKALAPLLDIQQRWSTCRHPAVWSSNAPARVKASICSSSPSPAATCMKACLRCSRIA